MCINQRQKKPGKSTGIKASAKPTTRARKRTFRNIFDGLLAVRNSFCPLQHIASPNVTPLPQKKERIF